MSPEEILLIYERNGCALELRRNNGAPLTRVELEARLRAWNGFPVEFSRTHLAFYWLLVHCPDRLVNLVSVQSILEAFQRGKDPSMPSVDEIAIDDPLVHLDRGTACLRIEHWRVDNSSEYWLFYCRAGGQALVYNGARLIKLWTEPYGQVDTIAGMHNWLCLEETTIPSDELGFYWLQSYGRQRRADCQPYQVDAVRYDCFPYAFPLWINCARYQITKELLLN